jgi:hypothetical protein
MDQIVAIFAVSNGYTDGVVESDIKKYEISDI